MIETIKQLEEEEHRRRVLERFESWEDYQGFLEYNDEILDYMQFDD